MKRELKLLLFFKNLCKVFCVAHGIGCWFCALVLDTDLNYIRIILAFMYCMIVGLALFVAYCYLEDKIHESYNAGVKINICKAIKLVLNDINRELIERNNL